MRQALPQHVSRLPRLRHWRRWASSDNGDLVYLSCSALGLLFAFGFRYITAVLAPLPLGDNDFDLIHIGLMLLQLCQLTWSIGLSLLGIGFSLWDLSRDSWRWWSVITLGLGTAAMCVVSAVMLT